MATAEVATRTSHNFTIHTSQNMQTTSGNLEMVAAQALLGVTPVDDESTTAPGEGPFTDDAEDTWEELAPAAAAMASTEDDFPVVQRRPRSDSAGLDALANLASLEQSKSEGRASTRQVHFLVSNEDDNRGGASSSDDDSDNHSEAMPPPPPRRRRRSASNPEGMDKWDPHEARLSGRRHFVLPASILEEELAEVSEAMKRQKHANRPSAHKNGSSKRGSREGKNSSASKDVPEDDDVDESTLTPDELLRRARSRLLEDLSYGLNGEKGELTFPHTLEKYQDIYNMNGRVGIYTAAERSAIIARFHRKRSRRVWNKKIRYGCRKSLADRRLRVKGRFVKRSEQEQLARLLAAKQGNGETGALDDEEEEDEDVDDDDKDMPDVDDQDAGFDPTDDSPYRRVRRHTIT